MATGSLKVSTGSIAEVPVPQEWFGPSALPLEVDFGCHRGAFLLGMARQYPAINFLGIEKQSARVEKCLSKIRREGLLNAHAIQGEGSGALACLPPGSVSKMHISFPDPWPKRRHSSRRLITAEFLGAIASTLRKDGVLRVMTDDYPYFTEIGKLLAGSGWEEIAWEDGVVRPATTFEKTFLRLGHRPHCCAVRPISRRS